MRQVSTIRGLELHANPLDLLAAWPPEEPVVLLRSGGKASAGRHSRWSILSSPEDWFVVEGDADSSPDPLIALDRALSATAGRAAPTGHEGPEDRPEPFQGGWIGCFSYDLGRAIEPAVAGASGAAGGGGASPWPLIALARCSAALVHDHRDGSWHAVGDPGRARHLVDLARSGRHEPPSQVPPGDTAAPKVGPWTSSLTPDAYLAAVERTLEYIAAGDILQANITQRLTASFSGSTRHLARRALHESCAWYGAYLELPGGRCVVSMSPELFLEFDAADRRVLTRPIKGTRPSGVDPRELLESEKDAAELHMIVDLMRNDLGRVCEFGSVRVPAVRSIESHPTVHHGVADVRGTLREDVTFGDLLRATFPGGSITGAPKIRAMQIIDELEPVARGPAFGAIGCISDTGDARLNIAIRTMLIDGARIDYSVGGGVVADSNPMDEYRESLVKAAILNRVLGPV